MGTGPFSPWTAAGRRCTGHRPHPSENRAVPGPASSRCLLPAFHSRSGPRNGTDAVGVRAGPGSPLPSRRA
ncbi:hypothetical protein SLI_1425 [Streptomyces lividans 1326]|uniref:Uncharacterized protein n=1 Tax=Streptomyces lividans 1326 TaxID=1200984 RepID=A0A7U9DNE4_STRLI|nr:hypothetical protein SLI_1425 [Streptomyces lividans 1326]